MGKVNWNRKWYLIKEEEEDVHRINSPAHNLIIEFKHDTLAECWYHWRWRWHSLSQDAPAPPKVGQTFILYRRIVKSLRFFCFSGHRNLWLRNIREFMGTDRDPKQEIRLEIYFLLIRGGGGEWSLYTTCSRCWHFHFHPFIFRWSPPLFCRQTNFTKCNYFRNPNRRRKTSSFTLHSSFVSNWVAAEEDDNKPSSAAVDAWCQVHRRRRYEERASQRNENN